MTRYIANVVRENRGNKPQLGEVNHWVFKFSSDRFGDLSKRRKTRFIRAKLRDLPRDEVNVPPEGFRDRERVMVARYEKGGGVVYRGRVAIPRKVRKYAG